MIVAWVEQAMVFHLMSGLVSENWLVDRNSLHHLRQASIKYQVTPQKPPDRTQAASETSDLSLKRFEGGFGS